jgi:hypothetical protein
VYHLPVLRSEESEALVLVRLVFNVVLHGDVSAECEIAGMRTNGAIFGYMSNEECCKLEKG